MSPAEVLARNDAYLVEFVERFNLCPYARPCREGNALERRVLEQRELVFEPCLTALEALSSASFTHVEIGLLILPNLQATFAEFERFAAELRRRRAEVETTPTWFVVPFHPESPPDAGDPGRVVSLLRRTPDPTLQLVRVSLLESIRGGVDPEDTVWMDPATCPAEPTAVTPARSVSTIIGDANFETVQRVGAERMLALLAALRGRR